MSGSPVQRRLKHLPEKVLRHVPPVGPHELHTPGGKPFIYVAEKADVMARSIVWDDLRTWERRTVEVLCEAFATSGRFWDLGAYAGIYTLLACATNDTIDVVAVEPVPLHAEWLERNLDANGWDARVRVVRRAVSPEPGTVDFTVVEDDVTASGIGATRAGRTFKVPTVALDDLGPAPDVIKIDVEGYETDALATGHDMLVAAKPLIVAECLDTSSLARLMSFLGPIGYTFEHLGDDGLHAVERPIAVPPKHCNFLARHPEHGQRDR